MSLYPNSTYLRDLAEEAGSIIRANFKLGMAKEWKEDETPLTVTDTAVNNLVLKVFRRDYEHIQVIGEEGSNEVQGAEYRVYCDPVDGTIPFCMGIPVSAFCISVVKEHTPLVAVICDPFNHRMWHATRGQGAFLGTNRVQVSRHTEIKRSNICMCWWGGSGYNLHGVCQKLMDAGAKWMNFASIAYFGGLVASGEMEATIFPGQYAWETAAMSLIVTEAGGKATDLFGDPIKYGDDGKMLSHGHVISNGLVHDELLRLVRDAQPSMVVMH